MKSKSCLTPDVAYITEIHDDTITITIKLGQTIDCGAVVGLDKDINQAVEKVIHNRLFRQEPSKCVIVVTGE
jgi:hypothetical protein